MEKALLTAQTNASTNTEVTTARLEQLAARRTQMKQLVTDLGRTVVDNATEPQMVQYYDDALNFGEEEAMKRLAATVRKMPASALPAAGGRASADRPRDKLSGGRVDISGPVLV